MSERHFEIVPLFSSPLASIEVVENLNQLEGCDVYDIVKKQDYALSYIKESPDNKNYSTHAYKLLDRFPKVKGLFLDYFYSFKNIVLGYNSTDFSITSSWATKTKKNSHCNLHNHANSMFSGVFYLGDYSDDLSGGLQFVDMNIKPSQFLVEPEGEFNIFNSVSWNFKPEKNTLVFFPSYLYHKIAFHESDTDRYSIAFNLIPTGKCGKYDSTMNIRLND
jgi:uncharacterized protein (TIGR02466 family)